ncbi:MAG: hypothetical protein JWQ81_2527 [Amycolatopsis sp.]|nr:hypothetical protein [Amycolatopsis sp.]
MIGIVECSQPGSPGDSAVLLGFRAGDGFGLAEPVQETGDADELAARLASLAAAHGRLLVVLGSTVDPAVAAIAGVDVLVADPGGACTGVWLELARHWQEWSDSYPAVALADHDALTRRGYLAVLRTTPASR